MKNKNTFIITMLLLLFVFYANAQETLSIKDTASVQLNMLPVNSAKIEPSQKSKSQNKILYGIASYYSPMFEGRQTANGEIFRQSKLTAACNVLPLGTWVQVTNLKNGKSIIVKINDRMHPRMKRIVDLTYTGAKKLDFLIAGLTKVKVTVLGKHYKNK